MKITGGCHCGKITYEAEVNPDNVLICHCTDCQVLSGSAYRSVVLSDTDAFEFLTGEPKIYIKISDSGNRRAQAFCGDCGSPFYATSAEDGPRQYGIRLGTVDQRDQLRPKKQVWCQSAQDWVDDIQNLPRTQKQ